LKLIVGLGNPGRRYAGTRHNVGFRVAEALARTRGVSLGRGRFHCRQAELSFGEEKAVLLLPSTYMNRSGAAVFAAVRFYDLPTSELLVICDDVHLPVGKLRLRRRGSEGGHHGLASITSRLGSQDFARLRVGIGETPAGLPREQYVLSRFRRDELPLIEEAINRAALAVELWAYYGLEEAMNRFN
jgi:PTH1 family peptidyl-tRNA hydrolase